jgi:hypothetical protein
MCAGKFNGVPQIQIRPLKKDVPANLLGWQNSNSSAQNSTIDPVSAHALCKVAERFQACGEMPILLNCNHKAIFSMFRSLDLKTAVHQHGTNAAVSIPCSALDLISSVHPHRTIPEVGIFTDSKNCSPQARYTLTRKFNSHTSHCSQSAILPHLLLQFTESSSCPPPA